MPLNAFLALNGLPSPTAHPSGGGRVDSWWCPSKTAWCPGTIRKHSHEDSEKSIDFFAPQLPRLLFLLLLFQASTSRRDELRRTCCRRCCCLPFPLLRLLRLVHRLSWQNVKGGRGEGGGDRNTQCSYHAHISCKDNESFFLREEEDLKSALCSYFATDANWVAPHCLQIVQKMLEKNRVEKIGSYRSTILLLNLKA